MTQGPGFFISPEGDRIPIASSHIRTVADDPDRFGVTTHDIESTYRKHGEKPGLEGRARDEILRKVMSTGWIRIRRYTNRYWSVQTGTVTGKTKNLITRWARDMLAGTHGYKEPDPHMRVKITSLDNGSTYDTSIESLAQCLIHPVDSSKPMPRG